MSESFGNELNLPALQAALLNGDIGLQGPTNAFTDAITEAESEISRQAEGLWAKTQMAINVIQLAMGHRIDAQPTELPSIFTESLQQHARQIVVAYGRMHGDEPDSRELSDAMPFIIEEVCAINGILGFTDSDFKRKRHPAMMMPSTEVQRFSLQARKDGYTSSYIKTLATKRNPWEALDEANKKLKAIREADTVNGSIGSEIRLATSRRDPLTVIETRDRLATRLLTQYKGDCIVKPADVRDAIDAHTIGEVAQALVNFRNNVFRLLVEHAGDPLIDLHTIRALCRRTGDPEKQIIIVRERYAKLIEKEPELSPKIAKYLARHYADPQETLDNARRIISTDPQLRARYEKSQKSTLWDVIQQAKRMSKKSTD
jgi:hypothetical protein